MPFYWTKNEEYVTLEDWKARLAVRLFEDQIPDPVETSFPRSTTDRYCVCSSWSSTRMVLVCHWQDKDRKFESSGSLQNDQKTGIQDTIVAVG